jgi:hypothetical protein
MDIEHQIAARNDLRREANLPLLDEREATRLRSAREDAAFERQWRTVQTDYAHLWADGRRGILTNSGIYSICRVRARKAFEADSH